MAAPDVGCGGPVFDPCDAPEGRPCGVPAADGSARPGGKVITGRAAIEVGPSSDAADFPVSARSSGTVPTVA
jgi:hypothetical protein